MPDPGSSEGKLLKHAMIVGLALALAGCEQMKRMTSSGTDETASPSGSAPAASPAGGNVRVVKSMDGSFDGELIGGDPAPGSKFSKVKIGMRKAQVEKLIGEPDDTDSHLTGKSFIPFYFGGDTHRVEQFYAGEGILTFSPAHFAGEPNTLVRIIVDPQEQGIAH
jgi:hypothetical protein